MADISYFDLQLDTTGPALESFKIGTGAAAVNSDLVTLNIKASAADTDVVSMKIWGDVDTTNDTDIQDTEATSNWITFAETKNIKLSSGDGSKTIYCKLRDNVLNEGDSLSATVTVDSTEPTVAIISGPTPNKISKIATKNESEFSFQCSEDFVEYKVCVVAASSATESIGTVIGTTNGSVNMTGTGKFSKDTPITSKINGADLEAASPGDGKKIIKIFVKDTAGNWSL